MPPAGDGAPTAGARPIHVLHVEDDSDFADLAATTLEREHAEIDVETAADAEVGLSALAGGEFDCVVSDFDMPGMDGLAFLEEVRERHDDLPFILFTGKGSEEIASEAISAGVTNYIQKGGGREQYAILANRIENAVERHRAERELHRYERVVEASGDVVYALDTEGRFTFVNDAYESLTGYAPEEVLGEYVSLTMAEEDIERGEAIIRRLLRDDERSHGTYEFDLHTKDGERIRVENHLALLRNEEGEFVGTTGVLREIEDRRERERELARYETIVERVPNGVFVVDEDAVTVDCNETVARMLGHTKEDLVGKPFEQLVEEGTVSSTILEDYPRAVQELLSLETDTDEATIQYDATVDGVERTYEVRLALRPFDEAFRGTIGIVLDVTEREERKQELERYARMVGVMGDGVYELDAEGRLVEFNDYVAEVTGLNPEELADASPARWYDDEDFQRFERAIRELLSEGDTDASRTVEATIHRDGGGEVPVEVNLTLLPMEDGEFQGTVGVVRDVSERKERELEFERHARIVGAMGDGVYAMDAEGRYTMVNEHMLELNGYDREDALGVGPELLHDAEDIERFEAAIAELTAEDDIEVATVEATLRTAQGEAVPIEVNLTLLPAEDGEFRGTVGVVRDITERRERELELERYETLVETSGDAMYALDEEGRYTFVNEALAVLGDFGKEGRLGEHVSNVMDPEDVERGEALIRELLADDDRQSGTFEMDVVSRDGERTPVENHVALLPTEGGEFRGTVGVLRDITERKEREETLEWYRTIIEATGDQIYSLDPQGRFTYVNRALTSFWGYDEDEILGEHVSRFMDEADVEEGEELIDELLESDDRRTGTYELTANMRDGRRIPVENHLAILTTEDGEFQGSTGVLRDISERKERERALRRQNERLDRFASMVSHDLRNPLNVAAGRVQMESKTNDSENVTKAMEALTRMNEMVDDVLSLAREGGQVVDPDDVDFARCVDAAWGTVDAGAATLDVPAEAGTVRADGSRLQQLLENLLRNAVDHGGPDVTVKVGRIDGQATGDGADAASTADGGVSAPGPSTAGFYVEDDGPGVPESERQRIFDFGETANEGGTGLGLAIVRDIAEAHGWSVRATEGDAGGARFEVTGVDWVED